MAGSLLIAACSSPAVNLVAKLVHAGMHVQF